MKFCIGALLVFFNSHAQAATVILSNGDQLTGKIVLLLGNQLKIKSSLFGEVVIPFDSVRQVIAPEVIRVELETGQVLNGNVQLNEQGELRIEQSEQEVVKVDRKALVAFNPPTSDSIVPYAGNFDLGGTFNRGNSRDDSYNFHGEFVRRTLKNRYTLGVEVNEAKSGGEQTTSNSRLFNQYDLFLSRKDYLFTNLKVEKDKFADLQLRSSFGLGYGRQFADSKITKLSAEAGLSYVKEDYSLAEDRSFPTLSLGFKFNHRLLNWNLIFFNNANMDVNLENSADLLFRNRLGLRVPLTNNVNLSAQFNLDHDRLPAPDKKKTDTAVIFSVGYGF